MKTARRSEPEFCRRAKNSTISQTDTHTEWLLELFVGAKNKTQCFVHNYWFPTALHDVPLQGVVTSSLIEQMNNQQETFDQRTRVSLY